MQVKTWLVRFLFPFKPNYLSLFSHLLGSSFFAIGSFLDTAAEEQRVNLRVGSLMRLAKEANVDFWADETRCRRIV